MSAGSLTESSFFRKQCDLLKNQRGSAAVDYAVILVFVVLVVMAVIAALQDRSDVIFRATTTQIGKFGSITPAE